MQPHQSKSISLPMWLGRRCPYTKRYTLIPTLLLFFLRSTIMASQREERSGQVSPLAVVDQISCKSWHNKQHMRLRAGVSQHSVLDSQVPSDVGGRGGVLTAGLAGCSMARFGWRSLSCGLLHVDGPANDAGEQRTASSSWPGQLWRAVANGSGGVGVGAAAVAA